MNCDRQKNGRSIKKMGRMFLYLFGIIIILCENASPAVAQCISLVKGPMVIDVKWCGPVNPEALFVPSKPQYKWIADLDQNSKKELFDSYRGLYVKGFVVSSQAIRTGIKDQKDALKGETIIFFIKPKAGQCAEIQGKRLSVVLMEECCQGGESAPCMLQTGFYLQSFKVAGAVSSGAGDVVREKAKKSVTYQKAEQAFKQKKMKEATKLYEKAKSEGSLDNNGIFNLATAYREMDECNRAIPILEVLEKKVEKGETWSDEETVVRKSIFLLARCYARTNQPAKALLILESYLLDPKKYRVELNGAIQNRDFGWINTSKEYQDFKRDAQKALNKK